MQILKATNSLFNRGPGNVVNVDTFPVIFEIVLVFQKDDTIVRAAVCHQKENAVARQETDTLFRNVTNVRHGSSTAQNSVKGPLAHNQVKGFVGKLKLLRHVGTNIIHLILLNLLGSLIGPEALVKGMVVLRLHLFNDRGGKINIDNLSSPPVPQHVFTKSAVSTAQN